MKKILSILLVLSMLTVFASCGLKKDGEATAESTTNASAEATVPYVPADSDNTGTTSATESSTKKNDVSKPNESKVPETTEEIVALYNSARKATKPAPKGKQSMALEGDITGDGLIGTLGPIITKAANGGLSKNSKETDYIPAYESADVKASDVKSATAKDDGNGNIVVTIYFNDQKDGADGDVYNGGPVARGVGSIGSMSENVSSVGGTLKSGADTISVTYTDAYAKNVVINQKTGKITGGEWHYLTDVFIGEATAQLGISLNLKNLNAKISYKVVI